MRFCSSPFSKKQSMGNKRTIERQVSDSVLQAQTETITIAGREYRYGRPTVATVIMVSSLVSQMPEVNTDINNAELTAEVLRVARDSSVIGEIAATLILGAKRVQEITEAPRKAHKTHWWTFRKRNDAKSQPNEYEALARDILLEMDAEEVSKMIVKNLSNLQLGSFFAITASLAEANVLKSTKSEAENT